MALPLCTDWKRAFESRVFQKRRRCQNTRFPKPKCYWYIYWHSLTFLSGAYRYASVKSEERLPNPLSAVCLLEAADSQMRIFKPNASGTKVSIWQMSDWENWMVQLMIGWWQNWNHIALFRYNLNVENKNKFH